MVNLNVWHLSAPVRCDSVEMAVRHSSQSSLRCRGGQRVARGWPLPLSLYPWRSVRYVCDMYSRLHFLQQVPSTWTGNESSEQFVGGQKILRHSTTPFWKKIFNIKKKKKSSNHVGKMSKTQLFSGNMSLHRRVDNRLLSSKVQHILIIYAYLKKEINGWHSICNYYRLTLPPS